jgi:hypothetical protein
MIDLWMQKSMDWMRDAVLTHMLSHAYKIYSRFISTKGYLKMWWMCGCISTIIPHMIVNLFIQVSLCSYHFWNFSEQKNYRSFINIFSSFLLTMVYIITRVLNGGRQLWVYSVALVSSGFLILSLFIISVRVYFFILILSILYGNKSIFVLSF